MRYYTLDDSRTARYALHDGEVWKSVDKVTVPKFIENRAKGLMKMNNGQIWEKLPYSIKYEEVTS